MFLVCGKSFILQTYSLLIHTFYQTVGVRTLFEQFSMTPKIARTNGDSKGKGKAITFSTVPENPFSLVSTKYVKEFEEKH